MALLLAAPLLADAAAPMHVKWEGLTVVDVQKTSDRTAYPKGVVRVPRATLHRFEMQTKGKVGRIMGTPVGFAVGAVVGGISAVVIGGSDWAVTAFAGITAVGTAGGYLLGNSVDKHWTPVEILP